MILTYRRSGGFAGRLIEKKLDTSDLEFEVARRLLLAIDRLPQITAEHRGKSLPDGTTNEVVIDDGQRERRHRLPSFEEARPILELFEKHGH